MRLATSGITVLVFVYCVYLVNAFYCNSRASLSAISFNQFTSCVPRPRVARVGTQRRDNSENCELQILCGDSSTMRLVDAFHRKPFDAFIGKSVKYVIAIGVTVVLLTSSSYSPLYFAIASVLNSALGKILKKLIRQPRPHLSRKSSFGMPSTHTLAAVYFCVVIFGKLDTVIEDSLLRNIIYTLSAIYTMVAW